jgi:xanthine/uracil permease
VAILLGFCPKLGAIVSATPGGVLGGITVVLYGMIGLLGAKIWIENHVDFANPVNLVPLAAALIAGIGGVSLKFTDDFSISGIALGTIFAIVFYHFVRWLAPQHLRIEPQGAGRGYEGGAMLSTGNVETPEGELSPFATEGSGPE